MWKGPSQVKLEDDLKELLNDVEAYSGLPCGPKGGCIFITDDCTSIDAALVKLLHGGSSYDFTYKLWDILKGNIKYYFYVCTKFLIAFSNQF